MYKIVFCFLLITSLTYSQTEKKVGDFHKVTVFDRIEVELISSDQNRVVLYGINSNDVEVVNRNGELKLRMPLIKLLDGENVKVKVYYVKLEAVEANEGSKISCKSFFKANFFDIIAKEGSKIDIRLEVSKLTAKILSGAEVIIHGSAKNQDVLITAGGIYEGKQLSTEQTVISINAGGEASIFASELVAAKVRAGGNIIIYGKPKQINQKTFAGGYIKVIE
jgi:hypothetical protein